MRVDKWLWVARFFKARTLASKACELGRVDCNGVRAKPSREIKSGDRLRIETDGGEFEIEVLGLSEQRGPAPEAQRLYREPDVSRERRLAAAAERKAMGGFTPAPVTRPDKRDRRRIVRFRGR